MPRLSRQQVIAESSLIRSDADRVYATISDYRQGHPRILPPQFRNLVVEKGGVGEGTVIRFDMRFLGTTRTVRGVVSEPEPGRALAETYEDEKSTVTTFTVDRMPGSQSRVTIATEMNLPDGLAGAIERRVTAWLLRPVYIREMQLLEAVAAASAGSASAGPV